ncbi:c-type cytochrome [Mesorhizobium sp. B2-8-1]|nr:c-type cytochrome [Mesorhizobium sp. B2-8-1]
MAAGEAIYHDNCSACHGGDGAGAPGLFSRRSPAIRS